MISAKKLDDYLGKKIKEKRESFTSGKLTQSELANLISLSRASVANIEAGTQSVSIFHLYMISEALNLNIADFLPSISEIKGLEDDVEFNYGNELHSISRREAEILSTFFKVDLIET